MSTAKRSRQRQSDTRPAASSHPAKKPRLSATPTGLGALVDANGKGRKTVDARLSNGVKDTSNNYMTDAQAVVASQLQAEHDVDMKDGSSVSGVSSSAGSDHEGETLQFLTNGRDKDMSNGIEAEKRDSEQNQSALPTVIETPSFGDMLLAKYPNTIDVPSTLADQSLHATALVPADNSRNLQPPPATSLGTVLTQALKTSDNELLESCLQINDIASIRSTIQRLQSPLVAKLMLKLAERIHKRPGRAGLLMRWIQWSLVAHGGYLASQPELVNRLRALFQVVRERANSLQPLMMLKGKLDLLSAQVELRRDHRRPQPLRNAQDDDYDNIDANDNVVYVEGQDESSSSEDETTPALKSKTRQDTDVDDILVNGLHDSESSDSDAEGPANLIDDEAIESDQDGLSEVSSEEEGDDDEEDEEDDDSMDGDEDAIDDDDESEIDEQPTSKKGAPLRRESLATKRPSRASLSSKRK